MPSFEHEFPLDLIRNDPGFAAELLREVSGTPLPEYTRVRCDAAEATSTALPYLNSDNVVVCERPPLPHEGDEPVSVLAIITEPQRSWDPRKLFSWPAYVSYTRHRLKCPIALLVLTPDSALAQRYDEPIDLGCGEIRPTVLGLDTLKPVTDQRVAAEHPVLTALAIATNPTEDRAALEALSVALHSLDASQSSLYSDYVLAALSAAALGSLEEIVKLRDYEFKTELIGRPFREGEAKGLTAAIIEVLEGRDLEVSDEVRQGINAMADRETLRAWVRKAVRVERAEDLFR
ncbi:hypothetical protein [Nocardiopsis aegyptia]|uniref:Uncharacterized protein n=1 Tax=Nocardiopsis aegyptia TaxID=220378 RepID=A0A7Z0JA82_9ACTN|nr:hypothetical protein [Nocardiopsis aegyptia]NYJ34155.1 hypothetical protein [Nocardiopsis aegyptia]